MRYYRLTDDLTIPGRWVLGEVVGCDSFDLTAGISVDAEAPRLEREQAGRALDFTMTTLDVPVATTALAEAISRLAGPNIQRIPALVAGQPGYEILNSVVVMDALDERRSEYLKWGPNDGQADRVGDYRMVSRLRVDGARVPASAHFFRLRGWEIALIVSERAKLEMERAGCLGAQFEDVS
jgi:hypothetical protein